MRLTRILMAALGACAIAGTLLVGCSNASNPSSSPSGAERSFSDEELANHEGSSYFPTEFTFDDLLEDERMAEGHAVEGGFSAGAYRVGAHEALAPGIYRAAGSQEDTGSLVVYEPAEEEGLYQLKYPLSYLGFALAELEEGDAIFFDPPNEADLLSPAPEGAEALEAPYASGLYRVGIDIPAGTYTITQEEASAAVLARTAYVSPEVLVYANLTFTDDYELAREALQPLEDGPQTVEVTVEDGQFLELYGCTATPKEA